jgi:hypothetical protein
LGAAEEEAVKQACREGLQMVEVTSFWQPRLFPEEGTDAIVYIKSNRGK